MRSKWNQKQKIDFNNNSEDLEQLPHSLTLEKKVLGTILTKPDTINIALKYINAKGMFYDNQNASVWDIILLLNTMGLPSSQSNVFIQCERAKNRELGIYASVLSKHAVPEWHLQKNCLILNEYWLRRTMHRMGLHVKMRALKMEIDPLDLLNEIQESAGKIMLHISKMKEATIVDSVQQLKKDIEDIQNNGTGVMGLPSFIRGINQVIKGYRRGNVIVIAAFSKEGKTTLALNEVQEWVEQNIPVGVISLEMKSAELLMLLASRRTGIPISIIMDGLMTGQQKNDYYAYLDKMKTMPLYITDQGGMTIGEIKAISRSWKAKHGIEALVIDHLHLVEHEDKSLLAESKFTIIANDLKALAKELDIPVLELAQFGRRDKSQGKREHVIQDLKYASGIEQAADVILMICRPEIHGETDHEGLNLAGFAKIIVGKLRLLQSSNIDCFFSGVGFEDWNEMQHRRPMVMKPNKPTVSLPMPMGGAAQKEDTGIDDEAPF